MKQVLIKKGQVIVEEVPAPLVEDNSILVDVYYSLISPGTEIAGVINSGESLLQRARKKPENVKKVLDMVKTQGISETLGKVKGKLEEAQPTGYSCAGVVDDVGKRIQDIKVGDRVTCAGAGKANHAEIVCVPRNLVVKVPDSLDIKDATSVTLGSIAMQGVRRADSHIGDIVVVIGLGLIGQITAQILKAAGCHVIGIDIAKPRVELAKQLGLDHGIVSEEMNPVDAVLRTSSGHGADATIITAATPSDVPVQQAMEITRKKGRVVVVGAVGLGLKRAPFYEKEIDFLISCSYGPGRYDEQYEEKGIDYPYGYVRWTENRNMQEYLRMLAESKVSFKALISKEYEIDDAPRAYQELKESQDRPLGVLLKYKQIETSAERRITVNPTPIKKEGIINVAVIGAGGFAQGMHLPNLKKLPEFYNIYAIVEKDGNKAKQVAKRFGTTYCTTDYQEVLKDENLDMVIITTRHNLHAKIAMEAAYAGKAVFVEKPMALNQEELDRLVAVLKETGVPFMVGFNRRFSPAARRAKDILSGHCSPLMILYRVNAGYLPLDHWTQTEEGGGRIVGEACHMFDLFQYLVSPARVVEVVSSGIVPKVEHISATDNVVATIRYDDGSVAMLFYTALGTSDLPKEYVEIYVDSKVLVIDDYRSLHVYDASVRGWSARAQDKGHLTELQAFARYVRSECESPISLLDMVETTGVSLSVVESVS